MEEKFTKKEFEGQNSIMNKNELDGLIVWLINFNGMSTRLEVRESRYLYVPINIFVKLYLKSFLQTAVKYFCQTQIILTLLYGFNYT